MPVDPELLAEIARRQGGAGASTPAAPGDGETYQFPVKQADGSDYNVPGGTNAPSVAAIPPMAAPAPTAPAAGSGVDPELLAEIARRQAAPAASAPSLWSKAMSNSVPGGGGITDPLGAIARIGGAVNRESQKELGYYADAQGQKLAKSGDYPTSTLGQAALVAPQALAATASELLPQNRFAAGTVLLGPALEAARAVGAGASEIPSMLSKFMAPAAEAAPEAPAAADAASSLAPSYTKPQFANGLLKAGLNEQVARNTAEGIGQDLASSQAADQAERASALPNMRALNAQKNTLDDLISQKNSEITDFQNAGGNPNLTPPEQARLKVLTSQLKALGNQRSNLAAQLSSAASGPGIPEMPPAQVPEANQIAVGEAEKATQQAQAAQYAARNPAPAPDAPPAPESVPAPTPTPASAAPSAPPNKPGWAAQLIQGRAGRGMSLGEAQYAIDNPNVLSDAKSIPEANAAYADSVSGLQGKTQSISQRLNQTIIGPGDYNNAINRAGRLLNGTPIASDGATALSPQDALEGVQTINQALRDKMYTSAMPPQQVGEILKVKDGLMDYLQNNGSPGMRAAAKDLFEAHVKDAFSNWLPQNKFGSTDALRTMSGMGQMAGGAALAAAGHPVGGAILAGNAALSSPRVLGSIIQNAGAAPAALSAGVKIAAPVLANEAGGPDTSKLPPALARILAAMPKQAAPAQPAVPPALARILAARRQGNQ